MKNSLQFEMHGSIFAGRFCEWLIRKWASNGADSQMGLIHKCSKFARDRLDGSSLQEMPLSRVSPTKWPIEDDNE